MPDYELLATHPAASALPLACDYGKYLLGGIAYQNKLYFGYGNWHKVSCEGTKQVLAFDPADNSFTHEFDAFTESIYDFRILANGDLYIPHIDPHASTGVFTGVNYSRRFANPEIDIWASATENSAWHVFDIQEMNGNMYLIGGVNNPGVGTVLESSDGEASFQSILEQGVSGVTTRFHFGFIWDNELYVQADKLDSCMIYDGNAWRSGPSLLPNSGQGFYSNHFADQVVYVSKDRGNAGRLYAFDGTGTISLKSQVIKYGIYNGTLYLIQSDGVIKSTTNLTSWSNLPQFTLAAPTCVVGYGDKLYFGASNSKIYRSTYAV